MALWLPNFLRGNEVARKVLGLLVPKSRLILPMSPEIYLGRWEDKVLSLMESCPGREWEAAVNGDLLPLGLQNRYLAVRNHPMENQTWVILMAQELEPVKAMLEYLENPEAPENKRWLTEIVSAEMEDFLSPDQEVEEQEELTLLDLVMNL